MKTVAAAMNQRYVRDGLIPMFIALTLLLFGATTVDSKESVSFVGELRSEMQMPVDVALSPDGNIYVLDQRLSQVNVFNPAGEFMFRFAEYGTGKGKLLNPESLAISADGEIIIADTGNNRVLVFNAQGRYLYQIGNSGDQAGQFGEPTLVALDNDGYIYVADIANRLISKFSPKGVYFESMPLDGRPADMAFDIQNNMYVLYPKEGKIVKRHIEGGMPEIIEFDWEGRDYIADTARLAIDARGDLYLIDSWTDSIVKIDQEQNLLLSFGSKGIGRGQFDHPLGIITDEHGKVYIADAKNKRVQIIEVNGSDKAMLQPADQRLPIVDFAETIFAEKALSDISFNEEYGLFALSEATGHILHQHMNELYVYGDFDNSKLLMQNPRAMHVQEDGKLLVADTGNNRLQFLDSDGSHDYFFGRKGDQNGQFDQLSGVAVSDNGNIYVADTKNNRIQIFNSDGIYLNAFGQKGELDEDHNPPQLGQFNQPTAVMFNSKEELYVLDSRNKRIQIFEKDGAPLRQIGAYGDLVEFDWPVDMALDESDNLYVADRGSHTVKVIDSDGELITEFGSDGQGRSYFPKLSAISASNGQIYVADYDRDEISVYNIHIDGQPVMAKKAKAPMTNKEDKASMLAKEAKAPAMDQKEETMAKQSKEEVKEEIKVTAVPAPDLKKGMLGIKIGANTADAMESKPLEMAQDKSAEMKPQVAAMPPPKSVSEGAEAQAGTEQADESEVAAKIEQDPNRLYFTQISYPIKTENMDEKLRYQMMRKMTLQLAISNVANQYGIPVEDIGPHIKIENESLLDDGRLKMTVSVPKELSKKAAGQDANGIRMSQLKK